MMKKKFRSFLYGAASVALLTACSGGDTAESGSSQTAKGTDDQTLTVWAWDTNFNIPIMEKAVRIRGYYSVHQSPSSSIELEI